MPTTQARPLDALLTEVRKVIVGQPGVLDRLLVALLCRGHVLLEGLPGLAKTRTIRTLADASHLAFRRIQFTPDLLPSDVVGTLIFDPKQLTFTPKKGPIFANLVLADEINRAPSKVQSALLEAMEERQVTLGDESFKLPDPFLVLATQNPLEQEGTFPLPEAQMDRFLFKLRVDYPGQQEEIEVLRRADGAGEAVRAVLDRLLVALLCRGHVLLEGLPGLAKTRTIRTLADASHLAFRRIQFTPDLLPSDVVGTLIFDPKALTFTPKKGPIFANLVLADEINRAPSKVQSALLEAME
ncbi:MAG TPA: AAA family ATPase, partial [Holophagaceae bacterium]|nr:AAA family ATPase [Holophagaceae bacterium]